MHLNVIVFFIQESNRRSGLAIDNDDDDAHDYLGDNNQLDISDVSSNMTGLEVAHEHDKENRKDQTSAKKWYEGNVARPVAFRATKRLNQN